MFRTPPRGLLLLASAAVVLALPALAQESILPPGFGNTASPPPQQTPAPSEPSTGARPQAAPGGGDQEIVETQELEPGEEMIEVAPPIELPAHARRDPFVAGAIDPLAIGLGANPWGGSSGDFLSRLMRRMDTPLASRWAHIALRNALLARVQAPKDVHPADWAAERAWLLLRMGEADAARLIVQGVDVDRFTPKMFQVAVQSALANGDPSGLCPLEIGIGEVEPRVHPLVQAMCAALAGEPESAASQIDTARRRGRVGGIDLVLAEKVVGAGADTGRAVTVEWEPVTQLNAWRFGLATATGMTFPARLADAAPARLRAWQARAPLIAPADRLESARIATGLGVFSGQALTDLYSLIYDSTDPDDLPSTDAWQLRQAFVGRDLERRLAAMRTLWRKGNETLDREANRALLGRAAARVVPDAELQADAAELIASMLAAGLDRQAARWAGAVEQMDDEYADACWAMLAVGAPSADDIDLGMDRITDFIDRDVSPGRRRSALLVAALAGLGRIDSDLGGRINGRFSLGIERRSRWTGFIDGAAARGQGATVAVLTGTGFQAAGLGQLPSAHLFHSTAALKRTGQDFMARMIAAEALSRTL